MKVSVLQLASVDDEAANMKKLEALIRSAAAEGARLVVLPEVAYYRGRSAEGIPDRLPGRATAFIAKLAKELGLFIHGGSFAETSAQTSKLYNTSFVVDTAGHVAAVYRKIHLFDVDLPELRLMESDTFAPGSELVTAPLADPAGPDRFTLGMLVCYDLRFPGVWMALRARGADLFTLPVNFTYKTGEAHWEVLLRARAIETQSYVAASAQWGVHPHKNFSAYGRAMIIDPWGTILAAADTEGDAVVTAEVSSARVAEIRTSMPVHGHRRSDVY